AVLAEHPLCLVVGKPAGVPTVPDRSGREPGVHGRLADLRPGEDLRIAHRLDRDTSGCLVLARGLEGARWLDAQLRAGAIAKHYLALVEGEVRRRAFSVQRALGPDPRRPGKVIVVRDGSKRSRPALTEFAVEEPFAGYTLLRAEPRTGR